MSHNTANTRRQQQHNKYTYKMPAALLSNHNSTTTTTPVIEDYYITGGRRSRNNNNKNNNDELLSDDGTTDDDESLDYNSEDDDNSMLSLSTVGSDRVVGDNLNSNSCNNDNNNNNNNNSINNSSNSINNKEGGINYLDNILAEEILHDYNDGDLQILNSLVNKLHEADVRRRNKIENHQHQQQQHQQQQLQQQDQRKHEQLQYGSSSPPPPSNHHSQDEGLMDDLPSEMPLHPPPFSPLKSTIISSLPSCSSGSISPLPTNTTSATNNNNSTKNNNTSATNNTTTASNTTSATNSNTNNSNNNTNNTNLTRQLSISTVQTSLHGPSIEIVPTVSLSNNPNLLHNWKLSWDEERREWETLREKRRGDRRCGGSVVGGMELRRSNTDFGAGGGGRNGSDDSITNGDGIGIIGADKGGGGGGGVVRRNRSMPSSSSTTAPATTATTTTATTTHKHNRYGKPTKLSPKPNPIVTKSSKRINRSHARYALTAGMMLGVRESVGGANGVECELEAWLWEEREGQQQQQYQQEQQQGESQEGEGQEEEQRQEGEVKSFEVVLGPITLSRVESLDNTKRTRSDNTHNNNNNEEDEEEEKMSFLEQQCTRITKYKFSPMTFYLGSNTSEPLPHKYKFKVYAPVVFQRIRSLFGVDKQTFLHSICGKFNLYEFASNAKSGQVSLCVHN
jgi:hypothetical protein